MKIEVVEYTGIGNPKKVCDNSEPNIEIVILVNIALYFANLEVDSDSNNNIPKTDEYR